MVHTYIEHPVIGTLRKNAPSYSNYLCHTKRGAVRMRPVCRHLKSCQTVVNIVSIIYIIV